MRLVTIRTGDGGTRAGHVVGEHVIELDYPDVGALLQSGPDWSRRVTNGGASHSLAGADLAPVVVNPGKVICVGLNYENHIREMGRELPKHPALFAKFGRALIGPRDPIALPPESSKVDWEAELGIVIGRVARRVPVAKAFEYVAGYTVVNDISMRDFQHRTQQFLQGKTWEKSCPIGDSVVTLDEIADPLDLALGCEVDGQIMQEARTGALLHGPAALVSYISTIVTLDPGDVIATGTPGGVGAGRTPQVFLRPGQVVRTWIDGVGELLNECVEERVKA